MSENGQDETALVPTLRPVEAPGVAAARAWLMPPGNLGEAMKVAELLAKSAFVPSDYRGKPGDVLCAIQYGAEIGLPPLQALQGVAVVNGRPSVYGDALLAVVQASGTVEDFEERIEGEGDAMAAVCRGKRLGRATPIVHRFAVADAKAAKLWGKQGPWTTSPKRMLQMRARAFVLRDGWADYLKGLSVREEAQDIELTPVEQPHAGVEMPRAADEAPADAAPPAPQYITEPQRRLLFAEAGKHGKDHTDLKEHLAMLGIASTAKIPAAQFDAVLAWAQRPASAPTDEEPGAAG